jgi:membrane fusion protein, macrolide-specific efflux system
MLKFLKRRWYLPVVALVAITTVLVVKVRKGRLAEYPLKLVDSTEAIYSLATVQANRIYTMKIGISSGIRKIHVSEGDVVRRGQRLVDFEDFPPMTTPIAGTVAGIYFKEGEAVFAQNRILTVIDLEDRTLALDLEEQGAIMVRKGQKCRVSFESMRDKSFEGSVKAIFPYEGQFRALLTLADMPKEILPGMTADVAIEVGKGKKAYYVPAEAVVDGKLTLRREGKKIQLPVQVANAASGKLQVQNSGLREGDVVLYKASSANR